MFQWDLSHSGFSSNSTTKSVSRFICSTRLWTNCKTDVRHENNITWWLVIRSLVENVGISGTLVARWTADQQVERSISCTRGMIHNKIHLISSGCSLPSKTLQVLNRGLKHQLFYFCWRIARLTHSLRMFQLITWCKHYRARGRHIDNKS